MNSTLVRLYFWQGHKWLPRTGWASSNVAHCCRLATALCCLLFCQKLGGQLPTCPPASYDPASDTRARLSLSCRINVHTVLVNSVRPWIVSVLLFTLSQYIRPFQFLASTLLWKTLLTPSPPLTRALLRRRQMQGHPNLESSNAKLRKAIDTRSTYFLCQSILSICFI